MITILVLPESDFYEKKLFQKKKTKFSQSFKAIWAVLDHSNPKIFFDG